MDRLEEASPGDGDGDLEAEAIRAHKREQLERRITDSSTERITGPSTDEPVYVESDGEFQELLAEHRLVLVDCYADWCGPCKMLEPIVDAVAAKTSVLVAKVDVDRHGTIAMELGVRGVPTLVLYHESEPVERLVGVQDEATLVRLIERFD